MQDVLGKIGRGLRKPPGYVLRRLAAEARVEAEKYWGPRRANRFDLRALLAALEADSLPALWTRLRDQPYAAAVAQTSAADYAKVCPGDAERILRSAEAALQHRVDLLGSGPIELGATIDWHRDYKTNLSWPVDYCKNIDFCNPDRPSDVKVPWEISRLHWLIPAGQAYLLTRNESYAESAREVLEQWIQGNPYARGINWACTMEVALRILSWTWLFRAFAGSIAWSAPQFQERFLRALFLHAIFTERHLERADINGNHFTADAAGLVFAGLFFDRGKQAQRWVELGWQILCDELPRQVHPDGVDFEASVAYHRLVLELFFLPALYRLRSGMEVPESYRERLARMAYFTAAYSRTDGSVPLWGDADDARALPFAGESVRINDHRYLLGLVGCTLAPKMNQYFSGSRAEVFWLLGAQEARALPARDVPEDAPGSEAFPQGGFYIMRGERDHVFIDCGPVGLAGRGGHGHNDLLSFEAVLNAVHLVSDCGAYVYTADYAARNRFRATAAHNTPRVEEAEINRFVSQSDLWTLRNDAQPVVHQWEVGEDRDLFRGSHTGYRRLACSATPTRTIILDKRAHSLTVIDEIEFETPRGAANGHAKAHAASADAKIKVEIPLHLAPGVSVTRCSAQEGKATLTAQGQEFSVEWEPAGDWQFSVEDANVSPSYGVIVPTKRLVWSSEGISQPRRLSVVISADRSPVA